MTWQVPETVTFEEAIHLTQALLAQIEAGQLSDREIQASITALVKSENGARGFFVTYLTDDTALADSPSEGVLTALQTSAEIVSELLVKNLAMSTAMAITHRYNNQEEMARGSDKVHQRTANLIQQTNLDLVSEKLQQLQESLATGEGKYQSFLQRWGYDAQQRQAIQKAVEHLETSAQSSKLLTG